MALFKKTEEMADGAADNQVSATKELYSEQAAGKTKAAGKPAGAKLDRVNQLLIRPLITEKGTDLNGLNKYLFVVDLAANKIEVAKAIETLYGVKPVAVNMINLEGKAKNYGRRSGRRKDWKKAIVTLPKGKSIDIYEGV